MFLLEDRLHGTRFHVHREVFVRRLIDLLEDQRLCRLYSSSGRIYVRRLIGLLKDRLYGTRSGWPLQHRQCQRESTVLAFSDHATKAIPTASFHWQGVENAGLAIVLCLLVLTAVFEAGLTQAALQKWMGMLGGVLLTYVLLAPVVKTVLKLKPTEVGLSWRHLLAACVRNHSILTAIAWSYICVHQWGYSISDRLASYCEALVILLAISPVLTAVIYLGPRADAQEAARGQGGKRGT